jgi:hypothetical protein
MRVAVLPSFLRVHWWYGPCSSRRAGNYVRSPPEAIQPGNAFTFGAGATSFGTGSGSRGSLADLKIVPGLAVMLAAGTVSAEAVS